MFRPGNPDGICSNVILLLDLIEKLIDGVFIRPMAEYKRKHSEDDEQDHATPNHTAALLLTCRVMWLGFKQGHIVLDAYLTVNVPTICTSSQSAFE